MTPKKISQLGFVFVLFILGIWTESILPFFGLLLILDSIRNKRFVKKTIAFLKSKTEKKFIIIEWITAIILAGWLLFFIQNNFVGIYTFHTSSMNGTLDPGDILLVNKLEPGVGRNINSEKWFHRSIGTSKLKHKDIIMFHFPEGDSLLKNRPTDSYYYLKRLYAKNELIGKKDKLSNLQYYPVDERPRFVKRVYGLPGDSITISNGIIYCNNKKITYPELSIGRYKISPELKPELVKNNIKPYNELITNDGIIWEIYEKDIKLLAQKGINLSTDCLPKNYPDALVFPFSIHLLWNMHNMGTIYVPKKGDKIEINLNNLKFYKRIISTFEENKIEIINDKILINGKESRYYQFKMDYYWVMGDNRPHSFDSRFWGFVPDNHIIGKVEYILYSKKTDSKSLFNYKDDRFFKAIN